MTEATMTVDEALRKAREKFGARILGASKHGDKRVYVDARPDAIVEMARYLLTELGLRFVIASAVDEVSHIEVLYHFALDRAAAVLTVRVVLEDRAAPAIDTITTVTRSAWWIEREIHELFGVMFNGNEDLRPLLLSDDWPKGVYPMRKDFLPPRRDSRKT